MGPVLAVRAQRMLQKIGIMQDSTDAFKGENTKFKKLVLIAVMLASIKFIVDGIIEFQT